MMATYPLEQWSTWRDTLTYRLRMKGVPGDQIGDILLEIETHIQESGETPTETLGNARTYADSRAADLGTPVNKWSVVWTAIGAFTGASILYDAALQLGRGARTVVLLPS